jgi:antitoxin VapB
MLHRKHLSACFFSRYPIREEDFTFFFKVSAGGCPWLDFYCEKYILLNIDHFVPANRRSLCMETAKLFSNGRSQAVRLPKEFRLEGKEVFIKKTGAGILLLPKNQSVWDAWEQSLLGEDSNAAGKEVEQEGMDELFA